MPLQRQVTQWPMGWTDGLPHSDHTPQSLAKTHTPYCEKTAGHKTHHWRLSTNSHSNVTIKERSRGQPPTSKWCLSALTPLSTLFIHPNIIFSWADWPCCVGFFISFHFFHYCSCPALFAFPLLLADFPWPHSHLDYGRGERNIKWTKVWEHLHEMRHSGWKIVQNGCAEC